MASTQALKTRIRSVKSTRQITKAMQLVAASKMRRAQEATKASDPYADAARELLTTLSAQPAVFDHPLYAKRDIKSRLLIVIASDKGLAGAYNSNVTRLFISELQKDAAAKVNTKVITIGRKASQFASRLKDVFVVGSYEDIPDRPDSRTMRTILATARTAFINGEVDAVDVLYTDFVSSVSQEATMLHLLPAGFEPSTESGMPKEVAYEPSARTVLDGVTSRLLGAQLYQSFLDAKASEHSMRMMAMKNATDNASDLIDDLTLAMNKARQAAITQELAEISGGVEALND